MRPRQLTDLLFVLGAYNDRLTSPKRMSAVKLNRLVPMHRRCPPHYECMMLGQRVIGALCAAPFRCRLMRTMCPEDFDGENFLAAGNIGNEHTFGGRPGGGVCVLWASRSTCRLFAGRLQRSRPGCVHRGGPGQPVALPVYVRNETRLLPRLAAAAGYPGTAQLMGQVRDNARLCPVHLPVTNCFKWRPHGDSNPGCRRERAVS